MATLTVINDFPKRLKFKGRLILNPGTNAIEESLLVDVWQSDPLLRWHYSKAGISFEKNGKAWSPDDAPERDKALPPDLQGRAIPQPTSELRAPEDAPEPVEEPEPEQPEVTPVGGGNVPGNAKQAVTSVRNTWDRARLEAWAESDTRATVLDAIEKQIDLLDQSDEDTEDG